MIEEQFVSFDTAKSLKEAGFDVECDWFYINDGSVDTGIVVRSTSPRDHNMGTGFLSRPTQTLAARWLREVHGIHVCTDISASGWYYSLCKSDNGTHILWSSYQGPNDGGKWDSYEEAMEAGLLKAIKLIKK